MTELELIQNSPEWELARCGSIGASDAPDAVRKTKTGPSATRANLIAIKVVERLTGVPYVGYRSKSMQDGHDRQPTAIALYGFLYNADIEPIGLVRHPRIVGAHASPDGFIGRHGLVEVKCPQPAAHLETLLTSKIERDYLVQIAWQLACTSRAWADYVSFNPDFPAAMQLFVKRVERDELLIDELEDEIELVLADIDYKVAGLHRLYGLQEAA